MRRNKILRDIDVVNATKELYEKKIGLEEPVRLTDIRLHLIAQDKIRQQDDFKKVSDKIRNALLRSGYWKIERMQNN